MSAQAFLDQIAERIERAIADGGQLRLRFDTEDALDQEERMFRFDVTVYTKGVFVNVVDADGIERASFGGEQKADFIQVHTWEGSQIGQDPTTLKLIDWNEYSAREETNE